MMLLTKVRRYRQLWGRHVERDRENINFMAVAKYLVSVDGSDQEMTDPVRLKDRIRRALSGEGLSPETLVMFVKGFDFTPAEAARLWSLYDPVVVSDDIVRGSLPSRTYGTIGARSTLQIIDQHFVGPDRFPAQHLTTQVIEANQDNLTNIVLLTDTDEVELFVEIGGTIEQQPSALDGYPAQMSIKLDKPLDFGASALIKYGFRFNYQELPPPRFTRIARQAVHNSAIWVRFHPDMVPKKVWWKIWQDYKHQQVLTENEVTLSDELTVYKHLTLLQDGVVGFEWEW